MTLIYIILATFVVSLISFVGVVGLAVSKKNLDKVLLVLVALAGGSLLGGAFLHLIPEAIEEIGVENMQMVFVFVIIGFLFFLLIEQFLHWHHCHTGEGVKASCKGHAHKMPMSKIILFGDGVHNLIDGLIIAASFMVDPVVGVVTTLAVALHEIPQEIGDFGVLVYGGYKKSKALLFNFLSGLTAVLGGVIGYFFANVSEQAMVYLLPIAAGGFIYIAASDLVPEIKHGERGVRMMLHFGVFVLGILFMFGMRFLPLGSH
jgi:zinc and cadmium transporter